MVTRNGILTFAGKNYGLHLETTVSIPSAVFLAIHCPRFDVADNLSGGSSTQNLGVSEVEFFKVLETLKRMEQEKDVKNCDHNCRLGNVQAGSLLLGPHKSVPYPSRQEQQERQAAAE